MISPPFSVQMHTWQSKNQTNYIILGTYKQTWMEWKWHCTWTSSPSSLVIIYDNKSEALSDIWLRCAELRTGLGSWVYTHIAEQMHPERGSDPLPAGQWLVARVQCCAPGKYLHGVDGDGESRVIPVHVAVLGSLVTRGPVLAGCTQPEYAQCDHQHQHAHTDDDNHCGHAGNHWDKGEQRECNYTCGPSNLNPTSLVRFQLTALPPLDWESGQTHAICLGWQKVLTSAHPLRWSTHKWCSQIS